MPSSDSKRQVESLRVRSTNKYHTIPFAGLAMLADKIIFLLSL